MQNQIERFGLGDVAWSRLRKGGLILRDKIVLCGWMKVVCYDRFGKIKWVDEGPNILVNVGLDYMLDVAIGGAGSQAQINPFFIGLTDGTPTVAAGDTHASHAGWVEVTAYSGTNRLDWAEGAASGQSITNASAVSFTMSATTTVGGAYLTEDQAHATTTGLLLAARAFTGGDQGVDNLDVLDVTYTINATTS